MLVSQQAFAQTEAIRSDTTYHELQLDDPLTRVIHRYTVPRVESAVVPFSGKLVVRSTDISISAGNAVCEFQRVFDPELSGEAALRGWRTNWDRYAARFGNMATLDTEDLTVQLTWDSDRLAYQSTSGDLLTFNDDGAIHETPGGAVATFDGAGQLAKVEYPDGSQFEVTRGPGGRIRQVTGPFRSWIEFAYSDTGRLLEVRGSDGSNVRFFYKDDDKRQEITSTSVTEYVYGEAGTLQRIIDPASPDSYFEYDEQGRVTRSGRDDGSFVTYQYEKQPFRFIESYSDSRHTISNLEDGRLKVVNSGPQGETSTAEFNAAGDLVLLVNEDGSRTAISYDELQRPLTVDIDGSVHRLEYTDTRRDPSIIIDDEENRFEFTYDVHQHLVKFNHNGTNLLRAVWTSDSQLRSLKAWDAPSRVFSYDSNGRPTRIQQGDGANVELYYDGHGRISEILDVLGHSRQYRYDDQNRVTEYIDKAGYRTSLTYASGRRPVGVTQPDGRKLQIAYDNVGRIARVSTDSDVVLECEYDERGNLIRQVDEFETQLKYDDVGNLIHSETPLGAWAFEYDEKGRRVSELGPEGSRQSYEFDDENHRLDVTDGLGRKTHYEFGDRDRLVAIRDAEGRESRLIYDKSGRLTEVVTPGDRTASIEYDEFGRLLSLQRNGIPVVARKYAGSRLMNVSGPSGILAEFHYDEQERQTTVNYANGEWLVFGYDAVGRVTSVRNAFGRTWQTRYTPNGERESVQGPDSSVCRYSYNFEGRLTEIRNGRGVSRTFAHDWQGRLLSECDGLGRTTNATWNDVGLLGTVELPDGSKQAMLYDGLGRCRSVRCTDGTELKYEYDAADNLTSEAVSDSIAHYKYDQLDRLIEATYEPSQQTVRSTYDELGRRSSLEIVGIGTIHYEYDDRDQLASAIDIHGRRTVFQYDEAGRLKRELFPNGVSVSRTYDERGRTSQLVANDAAAFPLIGRRFAYDLAGNLVREVRMTGDQFSMDYDEQNRLTGWHLGIRRTGATYDTVGNLIPDTGAEYDAADQLVYFGDEFFQYNDQGAMVERSRGQSTTTYVYDDRGCMTAVHRDGKLVAEYGYDAAGRRIWKKIDDAVTHFVYHGNQLLMETDTVGEMTRLWTPGPQANRPCMLTMADDTQYPIFDQAGSIVGLSNNNGVIEAQITYTPFGEIDSAEVLLSSGPGFGGGYYDQETGLVLFGLRYYDPHLGRFLTPDPVFGRLANPATLHRYQYALNNPLKYKDPTGTFAAELADKFSNVMGELGRSAGYRLGYGAGWLASSPARAWNWVTGDEKANERLNEGIDAFGSDVTGVALDTIAATASDFLTSSLDLGTGSGEASVDYEQGNYGRAILNVAGDAISVITPMLSRWNPFRSRPKELYAAYDNVDSILGAGWKGRTVSGNRRPGRLLGLTEGQVYAGVYPRDNKLGGLINGRPPKPGDVPFVFVDEAAAVFERHEVDGIFSFYKWVAHQHKGGFGDIRLDQWYRSASGEVVVTKATLLDGMHQGRQILGKLPDGGGFFNRIGPWYRLYGRRYALDPFLTGAVAVIALEGGEALRRIFPNYKEWLRFSPISDLQGLADDIDTWQKRIEELMDKLRQPNAVIPPELLPPGGLRPGTESDYVRRLNNLLSVLRDAIIEAVDEEEQSVGGDLDRARQLVEAGTRLERQLKEMADQLFKQRNELENRIRQLSVLEEKFKDLDDQRGDVRDLLKLLGFEVLKVDPDNKSRRRIWQILYPAAEVYAIQVCSLAGVYDSKEKAEQARRSATKMIRALAIDIKHANEATGAVDDLGGERMRNIAEQLKTAFQSYQDSLSHLEEYEDTLHQLENEYRQFTKIKQIGERWVKHFHKLNVDGKVGELLQGDRSNDATTVREEAKTLVTRFPLAAEYFRRSTEGNGQLDAKIDSARDVDRRLEKLSGRNRNDYRREQNSLQKDVTKLLNEVEGSLFQANAGFFLGDEETPELDALELVARRNVLKAMQRMLDCYNDIRWKEKKRERIGGGVGLTQEEEDELVVERETIHTFTRTIPKALEQISLPEAELSVPREGVTIVEESPNTTANPAEELALETERQSPHTRPLVGPDTKPDLREAPMTIPTRPGSRPRVPETPNDANASVQVPNVIGMKAEQVQKELRALGLRPDFKLGDPSPNAANQYKAYRQEPLPNTLVKKEALVAVTIFNRVADGIQVPNLIGMDAEQVQKRLQAVGLQLDVKVGHASPSVANQFKVYQQNPSPNTLVKKDSEVTVTLFDRAAADLKRPDTPARPKSSTPLAIPPRPQQEYVNLAGTWVANKADAAEWLRRNPGNRRDGWYSTHIVITQSGANTSSRFYKHNGGSYSEKGTLKEQVPENGRVFKDHSYIRLSPDGETMIFDITNGDNSKGIMRYNRRK
ncbi:RHS repeat-associated core domain-containing protein [Calycomorphotria hydatis]|nr:PASTA domain-containing protein [Calycomorphotria hydatis]